MIFDRVSRVTIDRTGELMPVVFTDAEYSVGHSTVNVRTGEGEVIFPLQTVVNITILF